jgi:hypothetical protein
MEKLFTQVSYWPGMVCLVIAVVWRIVSVFRGSATAGGPAIGHVAFMHGSILFLVAAIATVCYAWFNSQKP